VTTNPIVSHVALLTPYFAAGYRSPTPPFFCPALTFAHLARWNADLPKFVAPSSTLKLWDASPFGFAMNFPHQEIVIERPVIQPGATLQRFA